jgi:large-conductance mechanosensitive channel
MNFLYSLLAEVTVTPIPVPDDQYNSPGTIGFIVTFLMAAVAVFLIFDMTRRVRNTRYRNEIRAKLAQEELENLTVQKPERPIPPIKPNRENPEADLDR